MITKTTEQKIGEAIMLLLSALMTFTGFYYFYWIIEFITSY